MADQHAYTIPELLKGVIPCKRTKLYELINSGALKTRKLGSRRIALAADVEALLESLPVVEPKKAA